ncbi:MAG: DUF2326 domain-containing protein [Clostridiales bacterium]|jgi:hypothetical protein|nr:DUF2326 domain-containing protein [Clostridiales bacterium]
MLNEIICDKFISYSKPRGAINFHKGLNIIQEQGEEINSVGKSTFLLVIDFVFGGDDYVKVKNIVQHVGQHIIKFSFIFNGIKHNFSRNTQNSEKVNICDEYYNIIRSISIDKFRTMLSELYSISLKDITLSDIIGCYFRIYGKENFNVQLPLARFNAESKKNSLITFMKLHNCYTPLSAYNDDLKQKKKQMEAFKKASKYGFATAIKAGEYKENCKKIEQLNTQLQSLAKIGLDDILNLSQEQARMLAECKVRLDILMRNRKKLWIQYYAIKNLTIVRKFPTVDDYQELCNYFPYANLKKLNEIENFHKKMCDILAEEFSVSMSTILQLIEHTTRDIVLVEKEMERLSIPKRDLRVTFETYANLKQQMEALNNQNQLYLKIKKLSKSIREQRENYASLIIKKTSTIQNLLNSKIKELNYFIYEDDFIEPVLSITSLKSYCYRALKTIETTSNYKNLILWDLATLNVSQLPAIAHDTVILKNIDTKYTGRIIELYNRHTKQVFVAFDRTVTYPQNVQTIINKNTVLNLSTRGNELFGHSWSINKSIKAV